MSKVVLLVFALLTGGALYLTWYGIGTESFDTYRSVRGGSLGGSAFRGVK